MDVRGERKKSAPEKFMDAVFFPTGLGIKYDKKLTSTGHPIAGDAALLLGLTVNVSLIVGAAAGLIKITGIPAENAAHQKAALAASLQSEKLQAEQAAIQAGQLTVDLNGNPVPLTCVPSGSALICRGDALAKAAFEKAEKAKADAAFSQKVDALYVSGQRAPHK